MELMQSLDDGGAAWLVTNHRTMEARETGDSSQAGRHAVSIPPGMFHGLEDWSRTPEYRGSLQGRVGSASSLARMNTFNVNGKPMVTLLPYYSSACPAAGDSQRLRVTSSISNEGPNSGSDESRSKL